VCVLPGTQGWSASYARLGPHTVIMFMCAERLRAYAGLKSL
jgi:solute carrier family 25 uncoupling protein 8/9